ncbi:hypothetical protein SAMN05421538_12110 [Paracoccus isoporae]|uniref:Hemolysin-type calcium-binding repeat-containing protein n=1 Tax=Paracoccus isoporae TaxID=591205 RepID=A0A1G7HFG7_9RHOB|nr:calcium-binding protein [Paracoccus isoporae]SDE99222.1 hypothetical protein SAMN05421538_12110 [Paracoccus isoporae]
MSDEYVRKDHFGGNIILTNDSLKGSSSYRQMAREIQIHHFRYPGGTVTEKATWDNGGLDRIFGEPAEPGSPDYVVTIREALQFSVEKEAGLTVVVPTFQFFDQSTQSFDSAGFSEYLDALSQAMIEHPRAKIRMLEIGNEYWQRISAKEYGAIANEQIPLLKNFIQEMSEKISGWQQPDIGLQAGVQWRATQDASGIWQPVGVRESEEIAGMLTVDSRGLVSTVVQHSYPDATRKMQWQEDWALEPMRAYTTIEGFRSDLKFALTEYNVSPLTATGVHQAAVWIEQLSSRIASGVGEVHHWGMNYKWLSSKLYDAKLSPGETEEGTIITKATPTGQVFDIAEASLLGKRVISDSEASDQLTVGHGVTLTGFSDQAQKVIFAFNGSPQKSTISWEELQGGTHVTVHHLVDADSPVTAWFDESIPSSLPPGRIADARGDMKVLSGDAAPERIEVSPSEMVVLVLTKPGTPLVIEGAHNVTDPRTKMTDDHIVGGTSNDILRGHVGDDVIMGKDGNDLITAGKGADSVDGGTGHDVIFSGIGADTINAGPGADMVIAAGGDELW